MQSEKTEDASSASASTAAEKLQFTDMAYLENDRKEKQIHGSLELPFGLYELHNPAGVREHIYYHWHEEIEILQVLEGEAVFQLETTQYAAKAGDVFIVLPGQLHGALGIPEAPFGFRACLFHPELLFAKNSPLANRYMQPFIEGLRFLPDARFKDLNPKVEEIQQHWQNRIPDYELLLTALLFEIWREVYQASASRNKSSIQDYRFRMMVEYIQEHSQSDFKIEQMAKTFLVSEGTLSRMFKKSSGMTIIEYLNRCRVTNSLEYLKDPSLDITEAAMKAGFNYVSYYNRVFLRYMGLTPGEYRKSAFKESALKTELTEAITKAETKIEAELKKETGTKSAAELEKEVETEATAESKNKAMRKQR